MVSLTDVRRARGTGWSSDGAWLGTEYDGWVWRSGLGRCCFCCWEAGSWVTRRWSAAATGNTRGSETVSRRGGGRASGSRSGTAEGAGMDGSGGDGEVVEEVQWCAGW